MYILISITYLIIIIEYVNEVVNPTVILVAAAGIYFEINITIALCFKSFSATYAYRYYIFIITTIIFPPKEKLVT